MEVDICRGVRSKLKARSLAQEAIISEVHFNSLLRILHLIMTFQYCATCRRQRRREKAHDSNVWAPCNECFSRRQKYSDQLHSDRAYRSHLARQIAGYPCDTTNDSPHHPDDYPYFKYPRISFVENGYAKLIKDSFRQAEKRKGVGNHISRAFECPSRLVGQILPEMLLQCARWIRG